MPFSPEDTDSTDALELDRTKPSRAFSNATAREKTNRETSPLPRGGAEALLLEWAGRSKNLSAEDEIALLRIAHDTDVAPERREQASGALVRSNAKRVFQVVRKLRADPARVDMDEIYAAGLNGLNTAILKWSEDRASSAKDMGVARFASGATQWIYKMVMEEFRRQIAPDLTERDFFLLYRIARARETLRDAGVGDPTVEQIAEALRHWALVLCRKRFLEKKQHAAFGRVRPREIQAELAAWEGPDNFSDRELKARGALSLADTERLVGLAHRPGIARLDDLAGSDGERTLGETVAGEDNGSGGNSVPTDDRIFLAGLSRALGEKWDDLSYRHGWGMPRVEGTPATEFSAGEAALVEPLGLTDGELGLAVGEKSSVWVARRQRQALRLGGMAPRPMLLLDLVDDGPTPRPTLWTLLPQLGVVLGEEIDGGGSKAGPCPVGADGRPDIADIKEESFACRCGCGTSGDVFDWWAHGLGMPASIAAEERKRFGRLLRRRKEILGSPTVVSDTWRSTAVREILRGA